MVRSDSTPLLKTAADPGLSVSCRAYHDGARPWRLLRRSQRRQADAHSRRHRLSQPHPSLSTTLPLRAIVPAPSLAFGTHAVRQPCTIHPPYLHALASFAAPSPQPAPQSRSRPANPATSRLSRARSCPSRATRPALLSFATSLDGVLLRQEKKVVCWVIRGATSRKCRAQFADDEREYALLLSGRGRG